MVAEKSVLLVLEASPPSVEPPLSPDGAPVVFAVLVLDPASPLLVLLPLPPEAPVELPPLPLAFPPLALAFVLPPTEVSVPDVAAPLLAPVLLCETVVSQLPVQVLSPVLVWSPALPEVLAVPVETPIVAPEPPDAEALPPVPEASPPSPPLPPLPPLELEEPALCCVSPPVVVVLPVVLSTSVVDEVLLPQSPIPRKQVAAA